MLRQIDGGLQNGPITKKGSLPVTTSFFKKFSFSVRDSYKELTWCINYLNVHIHTFCKGWSFFRGCFLTVSILKVYKDQVVVPENREYVKVPRLSDCILKNKTYITITKQLTNSMQICNHFSRKPVLLLYV